MLIGDSSTEGVSLEFSETYAGLIAAELESNGIDVLNAGVSSYSPSIYFTKVRYLLEQVGLEFTEVVVFIDISDIQDEALYYDVQSDGRVVDQSPSEGRSTRWDAVKQVLKRHSATVRLADLISDRWSPPPQPDLSRSLWTVNDSLFESYGQKGLDRATQYMDSLATLLTIREIPLTVTVYPWPAQLRFDTPESKQVIHWRQWAERGGVAFVDLFQPFYFDPDPEQTIQTYYLPGDIHFNRAGSRFIAENFLEAFQSSR